MTATATDLGGNTSEFSNEFGGNQPPMASIGFTTLTVDEGVAVTFDGRARLIPTATRFSIPGRLATVKRRPAPRPSHTFKTVGIDTVTLTVSDGFGGTSTPRPRSRSRTLPPVFAPAIVHAAGVVRGAAAGDGFGGAVAAVDGNVAIAARFDNGASATMIPVRSTCTTAFRPTTASPQRVLTARSFTCFADPNPAPGDEFGASIAAVGNDLLVGAPGSSHSRDRATVRPICTMPTPIARPSASCWRPSRFADPDAAHHAAVRRIGRLGRYESS